MSDFKDQLQAMFVTEEQIPAEYGIKEIHRREYLVNGKVSQLYIPVMIS